MLLVFNMYFLTLLYNFFQATLIYLMDHLVLVVSQSEHNKMSPQNLAVCFGPVLMLQSQSIDKPLDFNQPINALRYLLEIWPVKSGTVLIILFETRYKIMKFVLQG